ncbi:MAG: leucyl aminopeptidase family protein [Alphaproteobacteria bacterium]|nr:leucyl aminopeptidase family protein [Alphaproteobacteria bacterium]
MASRSLSQTSAFIAKPKKNHIPVIAVKEGKYEAWLGKQPERIKALVKRSGFSPEGACGLMFHDPESGAVAGVYAGVHDRLKLFDMAAVCEMIGKNFSQEVLKETSFEIEGLSGDELNKAHIGWGWACYSFDIYKSKKAAPPLLVWAKGVDKADILRQVESVNLVRDLVNTPPNDMGPEEIEAAVKALAKAHEAKVTVIKDQKQLETDFPLIYTVGKASPRAPRLIEMVWGNAKHPKVTLVGKGVAFDTGGLDIKPSSSMALMKKDMGGAAHVIGLAKLIMDHGLPVRLRVLIPAVENVVGGAAYRPSDIIKSRKGVFVENTNTDAEGRLILADALAYACEDKPELVVDYATLTGSARAGLGPDIPAMFSNNEEVAQDIQKLAKKTEDPVWNMPLWQPYRKYLDSSNADIINSTGQAGDGIYSALFLETFVEKDTDWVHLDCFSWEMSGRPGRPKGAADTGLRTVFAYLQGRFG